MKYCLNYDGFDALRLLTTSSCDFYDCYDKNVRVSLKLNHSNHRNQINHSSDRGVVR
ncbi:MAG: hypothetical protein KA146_04945 [Leptospiraceae bacterium]|nr:hypothetical protein [Leptospiraceae bacterium]